jgi:exportin-1
LSFVVGLFERNTDISTFKRHVRDFLVRVKEFSGGDDNARLYLEEEEKAKQDKEMSVPGMIPPNDPRRENML